MVYFVLRVNGRDVERFSGDAGRFDAIQACKKLPRKCGGRVFVCFPVLREEKVVDRFIMVKDKARGKMSLLGGLASRPQFLPLAPTVLRWEEERVF